MNEDAVLDTNALIKNALVELRKARAELASAEYARHEPIAIIGMGCRFPNGANSPEAYWELLKNGTDAVSEVPSNRWDIDAYYDADPNAVGKMYTRSGAFLDEIDRFDPKFFGISPREAKDMDPQQRLLLEVGWESMEDAGQAPEHLMGSQTGVFMGIFRDDYAQMCATSEDFDRIDAYNSLGGARSIAVGRLSYQFGFQGPTVQLDTACSSSSLAIHLACQSLRAQECNLALAGGVMLMISPGPAISNCRLKAVAPDGRCKTFDAAADGYGRGEGCGIVVLKRLSDARKDGDRILATIRGSAVNHDGRSNGLTAPNGAAQETLMRQALTNAKLAPQQVQYIEAHGTGTSLGDPIEVMALNNVMGHKRTADNPIKLGSVKTNIGHLESAAGVAALIKVVLAMQHQQIPPHLHFQNPNPHIPWNRLPVEIPTELTPWPTTDDGKRFAGISAFGMSGTNVHLIVEDAPVVVTLAQPGVETPRLERPLHLLCLSAKTKTALQTSVTQYENWLNRREPVSLADICFTANTGRSHFNHRLSVLAESPQQLKQQLIAIANTLKTNEAKPLPGSSWAYTQRTHRKEPKTAFLFTGQGAQTIGMARELYESSPTFHATLEDCSTILETTLGCSLLDVLYNEETEPATGSPLHQTAFTQPALFTIEYALAQQWLSWGIEPIALMGHSVGEYAAACIAGVFSLADGLKLIAARGRLMQALPANGAMVVVFADGCEVAPYLSAFGDDITIAANNTPQNTVISGREETVAECVTQLESSGIRCHRLRVSHAFHSPLMEPMLADFRAVANEVSFHPPRRPLVSNLTGGLVSAEEVATAEYWCRHVRSPVEFKTGVGALVDLGCNHFIELGPKPVLLSMAQQCCNDAESRQWLASLRPGRSDWQQLLESLRTLYLGGARIDWSQFDKDYHRQRLSLPTYPFQRRRYWLTRTGAIKVLLKEPSADKTVPSVSVAMHNLPAVATLPLREPGEPTTQPQAPPALGSSPLLSQLYSAAAKDRLPLLTQFIQQSAAVVLGQGLDDLPTLQMGFFEMGMDSLMAVEFKQMLESSLKHSFSATLAFNYPNIEKLAHYIHQLIFSSLNASETLPKKQTFAQLVTQIESLSEAEAERRLLQRLATI